MFCEKENHMKTIISTARLILIALTFFIMPMRANAQDDNATLIAPKASLPELTAEEKAQPIAKYYFEAISEPDKAHMARMDNPSDAMKAIYPEQISDLLNPGDLDIEIGWYTLDNGAGFISNKILYPGVTAEMIDWWYVWHALDDLRYRVWYPPHHAGIAVGPEARERLLDESIPMNERNYNVTHHVVEDINGGMATIDITFLPPEAMGFDMSRWQAPNVATYAGGYGWVRPIDEDNAPASPAFMCHFFRETPEGMEQRTLFWLGYHLVDGEPELVLPPGVKIPEAATQGLARHNVAEYSRLRDLLPRLYTELGGKMTY